MNPKYDLANEHAIGEECSFLFGGSKKVKSNSFVLKVEDKAAMVGIYWRVFGTNIIINNEVLAWIMPSFIAHSKGHPINWAKMTKSITKEKAC